MHPRDHAPSPSRTTAPSGACRGRIVEALRTPNAGVARAARDHSRAARHDELVPPVDAGVERQDGRPAAVYAPSPAPLSQSPGLPFAAPAVEDALTKRWAPQTTRKAGVAGRSVTPALYVGEVPADPALLCAAAHACG